MERIFEGVGLHACAFGAQAVSDGFLFISALAYLVAWLVMGRGWGAAFKAPFAVLISGIALVTVHATLFDGFASLPETILAMVSFAAMYLFGIMCLRVAVPKRKAKTA